MPAQTRPTSVLFLDVNDVPAVKKLKKFTRTVKKNAQAWNQSLELASKAFAFLDRTLGSLIRQADRWGKQAAYQIQVETRLRAALAQRTTQVEAAFEAIQKENIARQDLLGIGDEEQLQLQGTLHLMGVRHTMLNSATEATLALADITGGGLNEAAKITAKVFQGNVGALKEYGIQAGSVQQAQAILAEKFKVTAANAQTVQGRIKALNANWADFTESLGMASQRSPVVRDTLNAISSAVKTLTATVSKDPRVLADLFVFAMEPALLFLRAISGALALTDKLYRARAEFAQVFGGDTPGEEDLNKSGLPGLAGGLKALDVLIDELAAAVQRAKAKPDDVLDFKTKTGKPKEPPLPDVKPGPDNTFFDPWRNAFQGFFNGDQFSTLRLMFERGAAQNRGVGAQRERDFLAINPADTLSGLGAIKNEFQEFLGLVERFDVTWKGVVDGLATGADLLSNALTSAVQGFGSVLGQHIADLITGADTLKKSVGEAVGDMIVALGTQLIQTGIGALILGALSFIPGLQPITGPPGAGLVAGGIAIAAGTAMVGVGKLMGGGGAPGASASGPGRSGGGRSSSGPRFDAVPDAGGLFRRDREAQTVVHEVHFNGIVGDPRRVRRQLADLWNDTSLSPNDPRRLP